MSREEKRVQREDNIRMGIRNGIIVVPMGQHGGYGLLLQIWKGGRNIHNIELDRNAAGEVITDLTSWVETQS